MPERFAEEITAGLKRTKSGLYIAPERKTLASGNTSCVYFNVGDEVISYPDVKSTFTRILAETFEGLGLKPDRIVGVPEGMHILTGSVSDILGIGQVRIREIPSGHGMERGIEGSFEPGMRVVIFEDVTSTGGSTQRRTLEPTIKAGLVPIGFVTAIDRHYGGMTLMRSLGLAAAASTNTTEITEVLLKDPETTEQQKKLLNEELEELKAFKEI